MWPRYGSSCTEIAAQDEGRRGAISGNLGSSRRTSVYDVTVTGRVAGEEREVRVPKESSRRSWCSPPRATTTSIGIVRATCRHRPLLLSLAPPWAAPGQRQASGRGVCRSGACGRAPFRTARARTPSTCLQGEGSEAAPRRRREESVHVPLQCGCRRRRRGTRRGRGRAPEDEIGGR